MSIRQYHNSRASGALVASSASALCCWSSFVTDTTARRCHMELVILIVGVWLISLVASIVLGHALARRSAGGRRSRR